jgi:purine-nucleoside phosphorylase
MLYEQIQQSIEYIRTITDFKPITGIILGTGLGDFTTEIQQKIEINYAEIPHFPISTVQGHSGKLIFGWLGGRPVVVMSGRFHWYEGYTMRQVTFPVRVLKGLGIQNIVVTNVSGSTNADILAGDLVFVRDHINLLPDNPLRGDHDDRLGVRFPDMSDVYDKTLIHKGLEICNLNHIRACTGVYVGFPGPSLETPSEYRFLNLIGGDLVGMSTVPEVIVAKHSDLKILVISVVSNQCFPPNIIQETTIESVIALAKATAPKLQFVIRNLLENNIL